MRLSLGSLENEQSSRSSASAGNPSRMSRTVPVARARKQHDAMVNLLCPAHFISASAASPSRVRPQASFYLCEARGSPLSGGRVEQQTCYKNCDRALTAEADHARVGGAMKHLFACAVG